METSGSLYSRLTAMIRNYWMSEQGRYYGDPTQRHIGYLLTAFLFGATTVLFFSARNAWLDSAPFYYVPRTITTVYCLETAVNFGCWTYLFNEWISRLCFGWRHLSKRRVWQTWVMHALAFGAAFWVQLTVVYERIDLYAPRIMHFLDTYPARQPTTWMWLAVFMPIWLTTVLLIGIFSRRQHQTAQRQYDEMMAQMVSAETQWTAQQEAAPETVDRGDRPVFLPLGGGRVQRLEPEAIQCICAEGHYCRFFAVDANGGNQVFTKIALKDILAKLPPGRFIQVHRSHVINLDHVERLKRHNRSYRIFIKGLASPLPVSRHRMAELQRSLAPFIATGGRATLDQGATEG